jgi:hypothetical protein
MAALIFSVRFWSVRLEPSVGPNRRMASLSEKTKSNVSMFFRSPRTFMEMSDLFSSDNDDSVSSRGLILLSMEVKALCRTVQRVGHKGFMEGASGASCNCIASKRASLFAEALTSTFSNEYVQLLCERQYVSNHSNLSCGILYRQI